MDRSINSTNGSNGTSGDPAVIKSDQKAIHPAPPPQPASDDLFDPKRLRLTQDFEANLGVKKHIVSVPTRKPDKHSFVRVRPEQEYQLDAMVIELRDDNETFVVVPELAHDFPSEVVAKRLHTAITRQGALFLWPVRLPGEAGKLDDWNSSALVAAKMAEEKWVRVVANRSLGAYDVVTASGDVPEPTWPDLAFPEILRIAFKGKIIDTADHPVLRRLRGEQ